MATAERISTPPPEVPPTVQLLLTEREAQCLLEVCRHVGGSPDGDRGRATIDRIKNALYTLNVGRLPESQKAIGSVSFND